MRRLALAAVFVLGAAASPSPILLREQAWTPAGATQAYDMTHAPGECALARTQASEIGRALFRSPNLLGGPAARAGLSCNSCHSNGRVNTRFMLPELTHRPGAADVTSEWASKTRGDGANNPVDIPNLAGVGSRAAFGRTRDPSLERFVHGVITEEFQGHEPPDQAFAGLIAYLRGIEVCRAPAARITLMITADDARRAVAAAEAADTETTPLLLLAAQDAVGRIVERLPAGRFGHERTRLETLSRELGAMRHADNVGVAMQTALPGWRARFDASVTRIARRERQTYYDERTLARALQR